MNRVLCFASDLLVSLRILTLGMAVLGLCVIANAKTANSDDKAVVRPVLTVNLAAPVYSLLQRRIKANGNVTAWREASVGAEVSGRIDSVPVQVGDRVKRYQVLAQFSKATLSSEVNVARAVLAEAQAAYDEAQRSSTRIRKLEKDGFMGAQMASQYYVAEATARARRDAAKASFETQNLRLQNATVRAPADGVIVQVNTVVGSLVPLGTEMFRLVRDGRLEWRAEVTAGEMNLIRPGMVVSVLLDGRGEVVLTAKVRSIAPSVNPQTRAGLVYVDLPAHPQLRPGMFVDGEIALGQTQALMLPQTALILRDGFSYTMKVDQNRRVWQTPVKTGRQQGALVEILSGLLPSDRVIASGGAFVSDGDLVNIAKALTPAHSMTTPVQKQ